MDEEDGVPDKQICGRRDDIHAQRAVTGVSEGGILERDGRPSDRGTGRVGLGRDGRDGGGGWEARVRSGLCRGREVDGGGGHEAAYSEHGDANTGEEHAMVEKGQERRGDVLDEVGSAGSEPEHGAQAAVWHGLGARQTLLVHKDSFRRPRSSSPPPIASRVSHVEGGGETWVGLLKRWDDDPMSSGPLLNSDMESLGGLLLLRGSTNSLLHCI